MGSFILENEVELSPWHYIRKAQSNSRWFDFSMGTLNRYKQQFNGDFCLVVNCDEINDDAYILPYHTVASMFTEDTLMNDDARAPRWMGTIDDNHLLKLTPSGLTMDLSQYHNAYHLLRGTLTKGKAWTRDELILAINLYCKIPFGKIDMKTPEVIQLAQRLNRTPGSISYKLANFASIDPTLPRKGASNVSKLDVKVWQEFFDNWDNLVFESEKKAAEIQDVPLDKFAGIDTNNLPDGETKERVVKTRVNQQFFRKMILSTYDYRCCITDLSIEELLIASHIVPWSKDKENRLNPSNGLCLNALHDRAFDKGLISFSNQYEMLVSERIKKSEPEEVDFFLRYNRQKINLPKRFLPNKDFIAYHRNNIFKAV